jgi:membrane-associated protein
MHRNGLFPVSCDRKAAPKTLSFYLTPRTLEVIQSIIDFILHIDKHLVEIVSNYKTWTYLILFLIIFAETGLVVTPFLPGDSLLFAAGAIVAKPESGLNIFLLCIILIVAAFLGDLVNYHVGDYIGPKAFSGRIRFLKREYLDKTQAFYNKYGGKTIIYARFVPIVRTFAPFVAGVGTMTYGRFASYNIIGALLWVISFLFLGYFFGGLPVIKSNFTFVIFAIILLSLLPPIIEWWRSRKKK